MYVMADLSDDIQECADIDDGTKPFKPSDEEVMLCVLTLGTHNVLSVFPDFSQMSVPYKISSPKSHSNQHRLGISDTPTYVTRFIPVRANPYVSANAFCRTRKGEQINEGGW